MTTSTDTTIRHLIAHGLEHTARGRYGDEQVDRVLTEDGWDVDAARSETLGEQYERVCARAARLYEQGRDTSEVDAEADRLQALLEAGAR